jgi:hypothetical protein
MNVVHHGTPFYPLGPHGFGGQLEAGFAEHQVPATLQGRNRIDALLRSIFSRCNNGYDAPTRSFTGGPLKVPFAVARGELKTFEDVDTRLCGWGPLTSGILLVAAAGMIFAAPRRREETRMFAAGAAIAICIIATVVVMPYAWWARFVPQLALLPVLAVALLWMRRGNTEHVIAVVLSALLLGNLLLIAVPCFTATVRKSALLRAQLRTLAAAKQPVLVAFHDYQFNRLRFAEAGIRYRAVPELPPGEKQMVLAGEVLISNTTVQIPE